MMRTLEVDAQEERLVDPRVALKERDGRVGVPAGLGRLDRAGVDAREQEAAARVTGVDGIADRWAGPDDALAHPPGDVLGHRRDIVKAARGRVRPSNVPL